MRRKGFRCFQTSRRSLHSCRSQAHCASCRAFLLPRSCEGKSATCAAPETVYPTHRCWGWSSAWLRACPCCRGGDTQNTCIEQAHRYGENMRSVSLKLFFLSFHSRIISLTCISFSCHCRYKQSKNIPGPYSIMPLPLPFPTFKNLSSIPSGIRTSTPTPVSLLLIEQTETSCFPLSCSST